MMVSILARRRWALGPDVLEMRQFLELAVAADHVVSSYPFQTTGAEILDAERPQRATKDDGPSQGIIAQSWPAGQIAQEPSGERVSRAGRIEHLLQRKGGGGKAMTLVEEKDSMLAPLDHQSLGTQGVNLLRGADQVVLLRKLPGLGVIDQEDIDPLQHLAQLLLRSLHPIVHGVGRDEPWTPHLLHHVHLELWMNVPQKNELRCPVSVGYGGLEILEDVQLGEAGGALVEVVAVLPSPAKCLPGRGLKPGEIDRPSLENVPLLVGEVVSHHRHDVDLSEKRGGERKMGGRSAQNLLDFTERCLYGVEGYRAHGENGHPLRLLFISSA